MFKEFVRAFFSLIRSPLLFLPALFAVIANLLVLYLLQEPIMVLLSEIIAGSFSGIAFIGGNPVFLISSFAVEFFWVFVLVFATLLINSWIGIVMARFAARQEEQKTEVLESTGFALKKIPRLLSWSVFVLLISAFFFVMFLVFSVVGEWNAIIGFLLLIAWFVAGVLSFFVLTLGVPIMGVEEANIKNSLLNAKKILQSHFWNLVGFFILLAIVLGVIQLIGSFISESIGEEIISIIILAVFLLLQVVIAHLALPFYYLEKSRS